MTTAYAGACTKIGEPNWEEGADGEEKTAGEEVCGSSEIFVVVVGAEDDDDDDDEDDAFAGEGGIVGRAVR